MGSGVSFDLRDLMENENELRRLYIVGQLHGAPDDLQRIDELIVTDMRAASTSSAVILHAGGYIDKGHRVPELLDIIEQRTSVGSMPVVYLTGAHEWLMCRAVQGDQHAALQWLLSGAEPSLAQWQVPSDGWTANLEATVPKKHLDFIAGLPMVAQLGPIRFVCSSFVVASARPFGLYGRWAETKSLFAWSPVTSIGRHSPLMKGVAPVSWSIRELWESGRVQCAVLEALQ